MILPEGLNSWQTFARHCKHISSSVKVGILDTTTRASLSPLSNVSSWIVLAIPPPASTSHSFEGTRSKPSLFSLLSTYDYTPLPGRHFSPLSSTYTHAPTPSVSARGASMSTVSDSYVPDDNTYGRHQSFFVNVLFLLLSILSALLENNLGSLRSYLFRWISRFFRLLFSRSKIVFR